MSSHRHCSRGSSCLAILVFAVLARGVVTAQPDSSYQDQKQRLADLQVRPLIDTWAQSSDSPGGVLALVEGDRVLILEGFGLADTTHGTPVDPSATLFQAGNLVRPMTATAVLRLAEQGALSLDEDLSRRPGLEFLDLGRFGSLTASQLLLHTAGFDQRAIASRAHPSEEVEPLSEYLARRMPPRVRIPDRISISSIHELALAGRLVEIAADRTFEEALSEWVFAPFAMSGSTVDLTALVDSSLATGYRRRDSGLIEVVPDLPRTIPASFLLTTGLDMGRWLRCVLNGGLLDGDRLLDPTSVGRLLTPQFTHHPALPGRTFAFKQGSQFSPPELYLAHRGNGFSSVVILLPHRRVGLFAAFNSEIDFWNLVYPILDTFDPLRSTTPTASTDVPVDSADHLDGYWQDAAVPLASAEKLLSLVRQDRLIGLYDGSIRWRSRRYLPVGPNEYREEGGGRRIAFLADPQQPTLAATGERVIERLEWHRARPIQASLWVAFATVFLIAGWPRPPLPRKAADLTPSDSFSPRWPVNLARLAATLFFLFIAALAFVLVGALRWNTPDLLHEVSPVLYAVLTLPLLGTALVPAVVVGVGFAWGSPNWTRGQRWRLTLLALALLLFPPFLWTWNLLGFHV